MLEQVPEGDEVDTAWFEFGLLYGAADDGHAGSLCLLAGGRRIDADPVPASLRGQPEEITGGAADVQHPARSHDPLNALQVTEEHATPCRTECPVVAES